MPGARRQLLVIADDFGIGPSTSAGILELAHLGVVTGSVLLVNSPYARADVASWYRAGRPMELGWHPNLTLDAPILPAHRIPSLVNARGLFWPLGTFMKKLFFGRIRGEDIAAEFRAQLHRFMDFVGQPPQLINSHQHVSIFPPVGPILLELMQKHAPRAYIRRVREPWGMIGRVAGARTKRALLNWHGRFMSRRQQACGFPGSDWLGGITDPGCLKRPGFFENWLQRIPGETVELMCHPGHLDATLLGRDCEAGPRWQRRVHELHLLGRPEFLEEVARAGFRLVAPSQLSNNEVAHAA